MKSSTRVALKGVKRMSNPTVGKIRMMALAGASAAAMTVAFGGSALAQSSAYDADLTGLFVLSANPIAAQQDYNLIVTFDQLVTSPTVAAIITGQTSVINSDSGTGFAAVTSNNSLTSTAKGTFIGAGAVLDQDGNPVNIADRVVDLSLLSASGGNDGIGVLSSQFVAGSVVSAQITAGSHSLLLDGFFSGTADVSGNRAVASTTVNENNADATVRGNLPVAYSSAQTASATGNFDGNTGLVEVDSSATVAITSVQFGFNAGPGAGSIASVTDRTVELSINDDALNLAVTAALSVTNNTLQAQYTGNLARSVFLAEGGNPNFVGSVVVSNNQANIETTAPTSTDYAAVVTGNTISATIGDVVVDGNGTTALQSTLNVSGNVIAGDARGNVAQSVGASGQPVVGNAIVFAPGINLTGNATTGSNVLNIPSSDILINNNTGDLVLFNGQGNQGTAIASQVDANSLLATTEEVIGGGINLSSNTVRSSATGNTAIGLIQVGGAATFDAIVSSGNLQTNDATPINAQNTGTQIIAKAGEATTAAPGQIIGGTFTVNGNAVTATATGNRSGDPTISSVSITASTLNSTGGLATVTSDSEEYGALTTSAGITAASLQNNYGETTGITANVSGGNIQVQLYNPNSVNLVDGTLSLNGNSFASAASGNVAFTGVELSGSQGAFSAAASSSQYNVNSIGATTANNTVFTFMDDLLNSTATLNANRFTASALGNSSTTSVEVTGFSDLTLGTTVANTWADPSIVTPVIPGGGLDTTAVGGLVSLNSQTNLGNVVGTVSNAGAPFVAMSANDLRDGATASISSNAIAASAIGNRGDTSLTLSTESLATASGSADQIATLSSRQTDNADLITSSVTQAGAPGAIGLIASGDIIDSTASVNSNRLTSFTAGNFAENSLSFAGTSYSANPVAGSAARMTFLNGGLDFETGAEFSVQNLQQAFNSTSAYSASVTGGVVGIALTGTVNGDVVIGSTLTVSGNVAEADARGNYAMNSLNLTGFSSLATSAALHNIQGVQGNVTASVLESEVGIEADGFNVSDNSVLTVTGNSATSRAIGNTGFNQLLVQAESLGGGNGVGSITKPTGLGLNAPYIVGGDYALASWQGMHNDVSASTTGMALIDLSAFTGGTTEDSTITVSGNSLTAVAQTNSVSNLVSLSTVSSTSLTAALLSEQRAGNPGVSPANATATAGATSDFATAIVTADIVSGTPIAVTGNSVTAIAGNNDATNRLAVSVGANLNGQASTAANATLATGTNQVLADFAVMNIQDASDGAVSATATPGAVGAIVNETVTNSPISVSGNSTTAQATINSALNTLSLTGASALNATAGLVNSQSNTAAGSAAATVQFGSVGAIVFDGVSGSPLNVSGNSYVATAAGNTATNALNATSSSVYGVSGSQAIGGAVVGGNAAQADYAVLNVQNNNAGIAATAQNLAIGVLSGGPVTGGSNMSVTNNIVSASATGNRAVNSIGLSSVAGTLPSASLTSAQSNTASVTATVSGVVIGIGAGGVGGSNAVVSGNNISATAIGNSARGTIGVGN